MEREELSSWLRLSLTPGIGNTAGRKLLAAFGLPADVFRQTPDALGQVASDAQVQALLRVPADLPRLIDQTLEWMHGADSHGATRRILTLSDAGYPASLLETADPPLMLYLLGAPAFDLTRLDRSIAIVGSRNPTSQGIENARGFARAFGQAGITVVSGLALGIDGAAHEGALEAAQGSGLCATVAVVGTGLDRVYPAKHRDLAHRIAAQGLIVSEYALGTPPLNQNFPKRNRIIAGLCSGTLVVEAALKSGSLITARLAAEQGREVFAIPGSIHSPQARGCHALIRQGAKLVESVNDVFEELRFDVAAPAAARSSGPGADAADEPALLRGLGFEPVSLDMLCARTGHSAADLQAKLLELELEGRVARLPGGLFQRVALG
ncbi:DNA-processing protein DprA [Variovorax sp. J22R115]|uniref:DNA-processing protein DprA n=1 Tax=Variovorax sp. J22R115 TaxID=3053509 RepID=UPI002574AD58|nr:DNA-processing protein DprA [Variovorax sp. J22R115]MDM0051177.1 DNA-processing protein DprA [Variovorax sp. J22R115]